MQFQNQEKILAAFNMNTYDLYSSISDYLHQMHNNAIIFHTIYIPKILCALVRCNFSALLYDQSSVVETVGMKI